MDFYLWIKALHVIAVMSWMAGMLYLPRLFIYHYETEIGSVDSERFKVMERRLLRTIINPAMVFSLLFGLIMIILDPNLLKGSAWLHAKLSLVSLLIVSHVLFSRWRRELERDERRRTTRFFRIANEIPTVLMVGIVILVIVKPF